METIKVIESFIKNAFFKKGNVQKIKNSSVLNKGNNQSVLNKILFFLLFYDIY